MIRLMLAEDESIARRGLVENIDWNGNGIELSGIAENGMEAYWLALERDPDIIITDIRMPVMDGLELIKKLREKMPSIHFIILSAHEEFAYARQAIQYGVDNYIVKPVDDRELVEKVLSVYQKNANIQKEIFQKNIDYLLLREDNNFIQSYQTLEEQLTRAFCILEFDKMWKIVDEIYKMFNGKDNRQYYRSACMRQFVQLREAFAVMNKDVFSGINSIIENELLRLDDNEVIHQWYRQKLKEYANILAVDTQPRVKHAVEKAELFIRENYTDDLNLQDVAAHVFVSPQYLSRIFHREKGIPFIEYLNNVRVEKAKELLRQINMPITEVAFHAGYNDYKYFSNVFKKCTGVTPREFRKNNV